MNECIYCTYEEEDLNLHYVCESCGVGMCDECWEAGTEHEYHLHRPLSVISPNMRQAIEEVVSKGGHRLYPEYLCEDCETDLSNYAKELK